MFNNSSKLCKLQKVEQNFKASEQVDKIYLLTCLSLVQTLNIQNFDSSP